VSVDAQITVLLALTAGLFDTVPLTSMVDAELAVCEAAMTIAAKVRGRFETAAELNDADRALIIACARQALVRFLPPPEAKAAPDAKTGPDAQAASSPEAAPNAEAAPDAKTAPTPAPVAPSDAKPASKMASRAT